MAMACYDFHDCSSIYLLILIKLVALIIFPGFIIWTWPSDTVFVGDARFLGRPDDEISRRVDRDPWPHPPPPPQQEEQHQTSHTILDWLVYFLVHVFIPFFGVLTVLCFPLLIMRFEPDDPPEILSGHWQREQGSGSGAD
ncbi:hypothetical protein FPQ18DRAFT_412445 [Pyronema domesticum]|uniref:Uncharacterized protein n=1 Tax=Pyronema omphalodes (strain CBS 100304) TaxID=1076935 RepID=U4LWZ1_PYROM|nr:hypothetical protein FPQ18DRAFT_412445 [Pyronema domesticum]CCX34153.1 Protein of unknown function [Pyronema omphalodes CBS 100304]